MNSNLIKNILQLKLNTEVLTNNKEVRGQNSATYEEFMKNLMTLNPKNWNAPPENVKTKRNLHKLQEVY